MRERLINRHRLRHRIRGWAGVVATGRGVEFAVARTESGQAQVAHHARVATVAELRQQFNPREYRVVTSVESEDVLCRTLWLPTTVPAELKQILDLQLDQLTPLPPEEVVYDFESLGVREGQTRVLVAIARKSAVDERVASLEEAGLTAEVVGVTALGVFRELMAKEVLPRDDKIGAVVSLHPTGAVVILYTDGLPLAVRSILLGQNLLEQRTGRQTVREELQRTLLAVQADEPRRELGRLTLHVPDESLRAVADELAQGWPLATDCLSNGTAPGAATSLCLDHAGATDRRLNLLPEEWRRRRQTARTRRLWWRVVTVLIVLYLLGVVALAVAWGLRKSQLTRLQAEQVSLATPFREARQLQSELNAMRLQLESKYSALDVLRQVSELMPPNVKLTTFIFRRDEAVTLKGQADSAQAALDFLSRLEQCELFAGVKPVSMPTQPGGGLTKFELLATLKTAAGKPAGSGT